MPMQTEVMYRYVLGCGHVYSATTKSMCAHCEEWTVDGDHDVPTADDIFHWFHCGQCKHGRVHVLTHEEAEAAMRHPMRSNGRKLGDYEVADAVDAAIVHHRIRRVIRLYKGAIPLQHVAALCGVNVKRVQRVIKLDPTLLPEPEDESDTSDIEPCPDKT